MIRKDCNYVTGAYDRCLECQYLGNGCDGPRTTSMSNERWLWWIKALKQIRGLSNADCVDGTGLGKATIDNIFAGNIKDVKRSTVGILEDFLIGSSGKWPCAMDLNADKDVVYMDKPETLAELEQRRAQVENLRTQVVFQREQIKTKDNYIAEFWSLVKELQQQLKHLREEREA